MIVISERSRLIRPRRAWPIKCTKAPSHAIDSGSLTGCVGMERSFSPPTIPLSRASASPAAPGLTITSLERSPPTITLNPAAEPPSIPCEETQARPRGFSGNQPHPAHVQPYQKDAPERQIGGMFIVPCPWPGMLNRRDASEDAPRATATTLNRRFWAGTSRLCRRSETACPPPTPCGSPSLSLTERSPERTMHIPVEHNPCGRVKSPRKGMQTDV